MDLYNIKIMWPHLSCLFKSEKSLIKKLLKIEKKQCSIKQRAVINCK